MQSQQASTVVYVNETCSQKTGLAGKQMQALNKASD
jgi:hypothetical protein